MNKLHFWLFCYLLAPTFGYSSGKLPDDFKFDKSSDTHRTSIISQLQRFEECNGDEKCIEQLKELERAGISIVVDSRSKVNCTTIQNKTNSSVSQVITITKR